MVPIVIVLRRDMDAQDVWHGDGLVAVFLAKLPAKCRAESRVGFYWSGMKAEWACREWVTGRCACREVIIARFLNVGRDREVMGCMKACRLSRLLFLEEFPLVVSLGRCREPELCVGRGHGHASPGCALEESLHDEVGFVDIFECSLFLSH